MSTLKWAHSSVLVMTLDGKIKGDRGDEKRGEHLRDRERAKIRGEFVLDGLCKMNASDIATEIEQNTMTTAGGVSRHVGFKLKIRRLVLN